MRNILIFCFAILTSQSTISQVPVANKNLKNAVPNPINDRFKKLEEENLQLKRDVQDLKASLESITAQVTQLKRDKEGLELKISGVNNSFKNLEATLSGLQTSFKNFTTSEYKNHYHILTGQPGTGSSNGVVTIKDNVPNVESFRNNLKKTGTPVTH